MVILREFPHVIPFAERVAVFQQLIAADKARLDARPVQVGSAWPCGLVCTPEYVLTHTYRMQMRRLSR
jgi:hypothetical protein